MQSIYEASHRKDRRRARTGTAPWVKPWRGRGGSTDLPSNAATGRHYSGVNVLLLWSAAIEKGFAQGKWFTFRQAHALGAQVRKGEHAEHIVFASSTAKKGDGDEEEQRWPRLSEQQSRFAKWGPAVWHRCRVAHGGGRSALATYRPTDAVDNSCSPLKLPV